MQIQSVLQAAPASGIVQGSQATSGSSSFTDILSNALQEAQQEEAVNDQNTLNLLSGDITDIHTATTQAKKAELSLNLAIQIRNKVIDAYNEVMRMQV